jgi:hypothetical protein
VGDDFQGIVPLQLDGTLAIRTKIVPCNTLRQRPSANKELFFLPVISFPSRGEISPTCFETVNRRHLHDQS